VVPHATGYRFQLAHEPAFNQPVVDTVTPFADYHHDGGLAPGLYYWRVYAVVEGGQASPWSAPLSINAVDLGAVGTAAPSAEKTLGIVWQV